MISTKDSVASVPHHKSALLFLLSLWPILFLYVSQNDMYSSLDPICCQTTTVLFKDKVLSVSAVSPRLFLCFLADGKSAIHMQTLSLQAMRIFDVSAVVCTCCSRSCSTGSGSGNPQVTRPVGDLISSPPLQLFVPLPAAVPFTGP